MSNDGLIDKRYQDSKVDWNTVSEKFLEDIKSGKSTNEVRALLYNTSIEELEKNLKSDEQKLAFWINIYNAYIQVILSENPKKYEDRQSFFKEEQLPIAGEMVSFAKIEHGIIRKSQWELGLGYVRKWFPDDFERKLRVENTDYRIHFALNCGAKDCPPVAIYTPKRLEEQLKENTKNYLKKTSTYNAKDKEVKVTSLFNWFRGDFGGKDGVLDILNQQKIIPTTNGIDIDYKNYDWTLDLDNWTTL
ncbi:DUF547 domain-containing protein [Euzebyella marina]|uniref:DUF547 domain-containing protein n=2 Tax=Euzebyella marina TaxID=1761453 RepID=A0A3G2L684_9FLAO|nr:DUF547 domain-containing protein [Euzebyella marina]